LTGLFVLTFREVFGLFDQITVQTHDRKSGCGTEIDVRPVSEIGLEKVRSYRIGELVQSVNLFLRRIVIVLDQEPNPYRGVAGRIPSEIYFERPHIGGKSVALYQFMNPTHFID